jgi:predicted Ser/Thr protein kinase
VAGRLGEGGMGVVYLAEHPQFGTAAVKFVRAGAGDQSFRQRFRREVEAARRVDSPRVARVLAADPDAEVPWLATAFVDGPTLAEAIEEQGPMADERLVALAVALADALAAIHEVGVVHRDLKPSNILLTSETPVVIDFGIAALHEAPTLTRTGMTLGTPGWMAPEQVRGQPCGPAADVFSWSLVVAYAAAGRPLFGRGPADALFYRVVHETPELPPLPPPLDTLVPGALAKQPHLRPDVDRLLASLTGETLDVTAAGDTALGATVADRTAIVPTIVARGWGVDALPAGAGAAAGAAGAAATFWFAGEEHRDPRSLAMSLQTAWDEAADQIFRHRDPTWLGELRAFLQSHAVADAERIVAAGTGDAPPMASMARLLAALDANLDPRIGRMWLTPDGLAAAAGAVAGPRMGGPMGSRDGRLGGLVHGLNDRIGGLADGANGDGNGIGGAVERDGDLGRRLAEIGAARVLRIWRGLPGMERAAAIDERWHASTESYGRLVTSVSRDAGLPAPAEWQRASATLLLCALHPDHERELEHRLAAARRTIARRQPWWSRLASQGSSSPAAALAAVTTADRARELARRDRESVRAADRVRRAHDRDRRAGERDERRRRQAIAATTAPRYAPLPQAQSGVRRAWVLALMMAALVGYLWAVDAFSDALAAHYALVDPDTAASRTRNAGDAADATGAAVALLIALPAMHVVTRKVLERGASRSRVRLYAGAAAALDLVLGMVLIPAATFGGMVLAAGIEGGVDPQVPTPFDPEKPWVSTGLLIPLGLVGLVLIVRSGWRLARVVFGRPVAMPLMPYPVPPPAPVSPRR